MRNGDRRQEPVENVSGTKYDGEVAINVPRPVIANRYSFCDGCVELELHLYSHGQINRIGMCHECDCVSKLFKEV